MRNPYYKALRGRSDDGFVGAVCIYIPDVNVTKKKEARKRRKEKKDNPSSAWFNSIVLYFIKKKEKKGKLDMRYMGIPKQALLHRLCEARENISTCPGM